MLAWPRLLGVPVERHLACSGATIANLTTGQTALAPDDRGQLVRLGELAPASAVLVTLGGNDAGFADVLRRCVLGSCVALIAQRSDALAALGARLEAAYRQIAAAAPGARVLVVGYPEIIPERPPAGLRCLWLARRRGARRPRLHRRAQCDARGGGGASRRRVRADRRRLRRPRALHGQQLGVPGAPQPVLDQSADAHPRPPGQAAMARRVAAYLEVAP